MIAGVDKLKHLRNQLNEVNNGIKTIQHRVNFVNKNVRQKLRARLNYLKEDRNNIFLKIEELKNSIEGILS
jgi:uncharacterized protein YoxC